MKKKIRLIILLILLIGISLLLGNKTYALTINKKGLMPTDYDLSDNYNGVYNNFCIEDTRTYRWATNSAVSHPQITQGVQLNDKVEYNVMSSDTGEIPPSVGYALWYLQKTGHLQEAYSAQNSVYWNTLQAVIYNATAKYGEDLCIQAVESPISNEVTKWSDIYAKCYYEIFSKLGGQKSMFEAYTTEEELAVNVDQEEKTIVVGPYYLELNVSASLESQRYLYNQLIRNGVDDNTAFATFDAIKNMNCDEGEKPIFINKNGKEIKFPNFITQEPFYIKFTPGNDGFITDVAKRNEEYKKKPVIVIDYINGFTGNITKYEDEVSKFNQFYINVEAPDVYVYFKKRIGEAWLDRCDASGAYWRRRFKVSVDVTFKTYHSFGDTTSVGGTDIAPFTLPELVTYEWRGPSENNPEKHEEYNEEGELTNVWYSDHWEPIGDASENQKDYKDIVENPGDQDMGPYTLGFSARLQHMVRITLMAGMNANGSGYRFIKNDDGASIVEDRSYCENKEINMLIQGSVWKDMPTESKAYTVDGKNDRVGNGTQQTTAGVDLVFPGVQVSLYELKDKSDGSPKLIATTTTDKNGKYYFFGKNPDSPEEPLMNPLRKYFVVFTFNGQLYQATYYKNKLAKGTNDGYSNAKEAVDHADYSMEITRNTINARFATISPSSNNYASPSKGGANAAYAYNGEIKDENGNLTGKQYRDVWAEFIQASTFKGSEVKDPVKEDYDKVWDRQQTYEEAYGSLATLDSVKNFIKDSMMTAKSYQMGDDTSLYPVYDQFQIESIDKTSNKYAGIEPRIDYSALPGDAWIRHKETRQGKTGKESSIGGPKSLSAEQKIQMEKMHLKRSEYNPPRPSQTTNASSGSYTVEWSTWNDKYNLSDYIVNYPKDYEVIGITYHYLYTVKSAQCFYANFGVTWREEPEMSIQKDVYKARVIVNGKEHTYNYNSSASGDSDENVWTTQLKAADVLYNASLGYNYMRDVYKSDYIFTGKGDEAIKNMQIIVTYRITLKNTGNVKMRVNELVDYYDYDNYQFDVATNTSPDSTGELPARWYNTYDYANGDGSNVTSSEPSSYIGSNKKGGIQSTGGLKVYGSSRTSKDGGYGNNYQAETLTGGNYNYHAIYLTGIVNQNGSEWFDPGQKGYVYVSFRVKTDSNGKIKLDESPDGSFSSYPGKRNIIEINSYSTKYVDAATVPDTLDDGDGRHDRAVGGQDAGLIDKSSNPGNLATTDLTSEGYLDYTVTEKNKEYKDEFGGNLFMDSRGEGLIADRIPHVEPDTDEALPFRVIIKLGVDTEVSGYVYEDNRNTANDNAIVGNGVDDSEPRISGVTTQLIELVQDVDENGISKGTYNSERVVGVYRSTNGVIDEVNNNVDYYSAKDSGGKSQVVYSDHSSNIFYVEPQKLSKGQYSFLSIPAGMYYVRFTYGDKTRTTLTNSNSNEVNVLLGEQGFNDKSYNGQDYKSTVYQAGLSQDHQYYGVSGFKNSDTQNYTSSSNDTEPLSITGDYKSRMYNYDINAGSARQGVSDAKDVYAYRQRQINYSTTVTNYKSEVLDSFEKLGTYVPTDASGKVDTNAQKSLQSSMVNELMENTKQVAQTGTIDVEVEYNRTSSSEEVGNNNGSEYKITDVDLGLVERPRSQLKMNKEIANFKVVLESGDVLFNATKTVNNLYFAEHQGHYVIYYRDHNAWNQNSGNLAQTQLPPRLYRLAGTIVSANSTETPELLQAYIDDELLEGARIQITYAYKVENVGEIDYLDKQFYYTGKTNNTSASNISRTSADTVIDYVTNEIKYAKDYNSENNWNVRYANELTNTSAKGETDLVNRQYATRLKTYNTLLTTEDMNGGLLPRAIASDYNEATSKDTSLILTTTVSTNNSGDNLVYNNLTEIVKMTNSQGRRMQFAIVGNQVMADQSLGNNAASSELSKIKLVTPSEIDADSAQQVVLMPPTGANKNYLPYILAALVSAGLIIAAVVIIKTKVLKGKAK